MGERLENRMSDRFPSLGVVIRRHRIERCSVSTPDSAEQWGRCVGCDFETHGFPLKGINWDVLALEITADHIAEMWREACTVDSHEKLDELPTGTVVRDAENDVMERGDEWWTSGAYEGPFSTAELLLPAIVLWHPDWSNT